MVYEEGPDTSLPPGSALPSFAMAHENPDPTESTPSAPASESATAESPSPNLSASSEETHDSAESPTEVEADSTEEAGDDEHEDDAEGEGEGIAESGSDSPPGEKKKRKRKRKKKASPDAPQRATDRAPFHVGEEVFGKVTAVVDAAIMVDLSGKALAIFDRSEMETDDLIPEVGDRFVGRILTDGGRGGLVVLTRKPLREEEEKPKIEQACKDGTFVSGLVTGVIKGGVEVLIGGVRAFAPASGVDLHPRAANLAQLVGQRLDFKVTSYEKQGRDVVVTRRPMIEKEAHERRKVARDRTASIHAWSEA